MKLRSIYIVLAATLAGCNKEPIPPPCPVPAERVFLMYDNINNDGSSRPFTANVNAAGMAVAAGALDPDERVVVYERMSSGNVVYELVRDSSAKNGYSKKDRIKYAAGEFSSLDVAETIAVVVGDIRALFPENPAWGLTFGSHGTGWLPEDASLKVRSSVASDDPFAPLWRVRENSLTRYFCGYGQNLDVSEFIDALDGNETDKWEWDFIILDDCFMAGIEVFYQMRTLADYIIASPTEIMIDGFPYDRVVESVFSDWTEAGFVQVGAEYVDYYSGLSSYPYGTVAVIRTDQLGALAASVRAIRLDGYRNPDASAAAAMQTYEGLTTHVFYDFDQYIDYWAQNRSLYEQFAVQLDRTVLYKGHTDCFPTMYPSGYYLTPLPITTSHYSGVNAFIPTTATDKLTPFWERTEWYKAVYAE